MKDGRLRTNTSLIEALSQTTTATYTDGGATVLGADEKAYLSIIIPAGQSCTIDGAGTPMPIPGGVAETTVIQGLFYGPITLTAGAGETGPYMRTYVGAIQHEDI